MLPAASFLRWIPFAGACAAAAAVVLAARPAPVALADEAARRAVFSALAGSEAGWRQRAAAGFPVDPWSQDDDFHNQEQRFLSAQASARRVGLGSLLAAVDQGMREGWPVPPGAVTRATVPPCRPRPIY